MPPTQPTSVSPKKQYTYILNAIKTKVYHQIKIHIHSEFHRHMLQAHTCTKKTPNKFTYIPNVTDINYMRIPQNNTSNISDIL